MLQYLKRHRRSSAVIAGGLVLLMLTGGAVLVLGPARLLDRRAPVASSTPSAWASALALPTTTATPLPTDVPSPTPSPVPSPTPTCVDVASWPVSQRLNQLLMVSGDFANLGASTPEAAAGVGAFVFFGQPPAGSGPGIHDGLATLVNDAHSAGMVAPWMSTDEEGGYVARLANVVGALPSPRRMAAIWSPAQVQAIMTAHASAMQKLGITMDLAPVLDTALPTNTIADESDRSFSFDPGVAAAYGVAYASGLRAGGLVAVGKHFPGFGQATANTDLAAASVPPLAELQSRDLIPFEQAIRQGLPAIMITHASVPGLTGGVPSSLSPATYQYLRNSLRFTGVAVTDDLNARAITVAGYSSSQAAVKAIESGADMAMIDAAQWQPSLAALMRQADTQALPLSQIDASVSRILTAKGLRVCQ